MNPEARWFQKSDLKYSVPWKSKPSARMRDVVNFERWDSFTRELVDRKLNVTGYRKSLKQARNQALVASQHGVRVRWEVPLIRENAARNLLARAGVSHLITVRGVR